VIDPHDLQRFIAALILACFTVGVIVGYWLAMLTVAVGGRP
jgi:uncharacterized protein YneF (UPF0154 family)